MKTFHLKTKISALIKESPDVIDAIAGINPHFQKLKNPILRKVLAPRVTIEDAIRIGNSSKEAFEACLKPLGFVWEEMTSDDSGNAMKTEDIHDKLKAGGANIVFINASEILAGGADPFNSIMEKLRQMGPEDILRVDAPFEPAPLIRILKEKGYESYSEEKNGNFINYFVKGTVIEEKEIRHGYDLVPLSEIEKTRELFEGIIREIDVRGMEMPMPMVTIETVLEKTLEGEAIYIYHQRIPVFLIEKIQSKVKRILVGQVSDHDVRMFIVK